MQISVSVEQMPNASTSPIYSTRFLDESITSSTPCVCDDYRLSLPDN